MFHFLLGEQLQGYSVPHMFVHRGHTSKGVIITVPAGKVSCLVSWAGSSLCQACPFSRIVNPRRKAQAEGYCNHLVIFCPSVRLSIRPSVHPPSVCPSSIRLSMCHIYGTRDTFYAIICRGNKILKTALAAI